MKTKYDEIFDMLDELEADKYAESETTENGIRYIVLVCEQQLIKTIRNNIKSIKDSE